MRGHNAIDGCWPALWPGVNIKARQIGGFTEPGRTGARKDTITNLGIVCVGCLCVCVLCVCSLS